MIVGKIVKPQGVKGEVKILPLLSDIDDFKSFKKVFIENVKHDVLSVRVHEGFIYVLLSGITDRNIAENFRDKMVEVDREDLKDLADGEYYIVDLIECKLFDENDNQLARVIDVVNYGASDILVLRDGSEEILCPYVKELFVSVDLENKKIVVNKKRFKELTETDENWYFNFI